MGQSVSQTVNTSHLCGCKYSTSGVVTRRIHASLKDPLQSGGDFLVSHISCILSVVLQCKPPPPPKSLGTFIESFLCTSTKNAIALPCFFVKLLFSTCNVATCSCFTSIQGKLNVQSVIIHNFHLVVWLQASPLVQPPLPPSDKRTDTLRCKCVHPVNEATESELDLGLGTSSRLGTSHCV